MRSILLLTWMALSVSAADPADGPKGPPPQIVWLTGGPEATFDRTYTEAVPQTYMYEVDVTKGDKVFKEKRTATRMVYVTKVARATLKGATGQTVGGKKLDADAVAKMLAKPALVLFSANSGPIDPAYLKLFAADTVILTPVAVKGPLPGGPKVIEEPKIIEGKVIEEPKKIERKPEPGKKIID